VSNPKRGNPNINPVYGETKKQPIYDKGTGTEEEQYRK
jgi:hypothetical protein